MADKEPVVDSDDDHNTGLVISEVKSLAEEIHISDESCNTKPKVPIVGIGPEKVNLPLLKSTYGGGGGDSRESINEIIPDIEQCMSNWKKIFPWVQCSKSNKLVCEVCRWGFNYPKHFEVVQLQSQSDKFSVAAKLRIHSKKKFHCTAEYEQKLTLKLWQEIYSSVKLKILDVSNMATFRQHLSLNFTDQRLETSLISHVLQNLANIIQERNLESLCASPYFSIIAFSSSNFLILRWLTPENEIVEHCFCSHVQANNMKLPVMAYLQDKGVDMSHMVSFSNLVEPPQEFIRRATKAVNVSNRLCPVDNLICWLSHSKLLKDIICHLEAVARLFSVTRLPMVLNNKLKVLKSLDISEVYKALSVENVLFTILHHSTTLDSIRLNFLTAKEFERLNFDRLKNEMNHSVCEILHLLPELRKIVEDVDSPDCLKNLEILQSIVQSIKKEIHILHDECEDVNRINSEEEFVVSVIDMFIQLAVLTKKSQGSTHFPYIDMLSKRVEQITLQEYEDVFTLFMPSLKNGKGLYQLKQLQNSFKETRNASPLKLIAMLQRAGSHEEFPDLFKLGQMIMVIPTLNAHVERYAFDITAAELFLSTKAPKELVCALMFIYLEGPDEFECLNTEKMMNLIFRDS